ncbi:MAG: hypothetical protein AAGD07_22655 [Planctomycetota bacterium]
MLLLVWGAAGTWAQGESPHVRGFQEDILPLVQSFCVDCHGSDEADAELDLSASEEVVEFLLNARQFQKQHSPHVAHLSIVGDTKRKESVIWMGPVGEAWMEVNIPISGVYAFGGRIGYLGPEKPSESSPVEKRLNQPDPLVPRMRLLLDDTVLGTFVPENVVFGRDYDTEPQMAMSARGESFALCHCRSCQWTHHNGAPSRDAFRNADGEPVGLDAQCRKRARPEFRRQHGIANVELIGTESVRS